VQRPDSAAVRQALAVVLTDLGARLIRRCAHALACMHACAHACTAACIQRMRIPMHVCMHACTHACTAACMQCASPFPPAALQQGHNSHASAAQAPS
jgi:hypothetical protein